MNIGIEQNTRLIYEATSRHGYPLWPSPVMLQVVITSEDDKEFTAIERVRLDRSVRKLTLFFCLKQEFQPSLTPLIASEKLAAATVNSLVAT